MKETMRNGMRLSLLALVGVLAIAGCSLGGGDNVGLPGAGPVDLGTAGDFAVLAKTAVVNVPSSSITGDVGLSPAATSYFEGFSQTDATGYATSNQVDGRLYAADMASPTSSMLTTAVSDMEAAYTDAATRTIPDFINHGAGAIGGMTLVPGLYKWDTTVTLLDDVTLSGGSSEYWIFQITGNLTVAAAKSVILSGGAAASNIVWQVAGIASMGTTSHMEGVILSQTEITLSTGSSLNGRALAQSQVTLDQATVTEP